MFDLGRTVRFCVSPSGSGRDLSGWNTFAASPPVTGLGAYHELHVRFAGHPDPITGYLVDISAVDQAVREHAVPVIEQALLSRPQQDAGRLLRRIVHALQSVLPRTMRSVTWRLTPFYSLTLESESMDLALISQQFEFAAAHRLHCPQLSDAENRRIFGKCNSPSGHGHNYRLEVTVAVALPDEEEPPSFTLDDLERIVDQRVVQRFDHTHLNLDTAEFARLNPSVEHITKVCYELLREPLAEVGVELRRVTVWETEKTACTYPAK